MKKFAFFWFVAAFLALPAAIQASEYGERVVFPSTFRGTSEQVTGFLKLPSDLSRPVPAIVVMHGSSGLGAREILDVNQWPGMGIAILVVDSFSSRGVKDLVEDQSKISTFQLVADAFGALRFLQADQRIDGKRIAIMGRSKGGIVTNWTAMRDMVAARREPVENRFAAHVALYPDCAVQFQQPITTGAPMLMLLGNKDDYADPENCRSFARRIKDGGGNVTVIEYDGAYHAFDSPDSSKKTYLGNAQNGSKCRVQIDARLRLVDPQTNQAFENQEKQQSWLKSCQTRGATIGPDSSARAASRTDIELFLKKTLF